MFSLWTIESEWHDMEILTPKKVFIDILLGINAVSLLCIGLSHLI